MFVSRLSVDQDVLLDANDIAYALLIKPLQPFFAAKFPVHGQSMNVFDRHNFEQISGDLDPLLGVGISPLCGLG